MADFFMSNTTSNMASPPAFIVHQRRAITAPGASRRIIKTEYHPQRHSLLDELTFNRDFDISSTASINKGAKPWAFDASYSGYMTGRLQQKPDRRLPVTMMDMSMSSHATWPQVAPGLESFRIKHSPQLRGFVTGKISAEPFVKAQLSRAPFRTIEHDLVTSHQQDLLVNMATPTEYPQPLSPPAGRTTCDILNRPVPKHNPGRHRYFLGDVPPKIR
eukprot:CAMPEP_0174725398 /NCGR_PEP_ID=MMETSP1094-20130205/45461_1 /TAXON_ID=156173 /ORGANISM="Chrysochromulina brevifilum, Strain UTEX LB 985" /LENGTH=216 /DNA_ID=CAMNT_0015926787 /DNA_START=8 /DNA_END=658 /DNA_ORIENTATION=-